MLLVKRKVTIQTSLFLLYPLCLLVYTSGKMRPGKTMTLLALKKRKERNGIRQARYTYVVYRKLLVSDNYTYIHLCFLSWQNKGLVDMSLK